MPPFHLVDEGKILPQGYGDDQTYNFKYGTNEINSSLLVTYTHGQGEQNIACHVRPQKICTCEQSEQLGAWEAGFEYQEDVVPIGSHRRMCLVHSNNFVVWQGTGNHCLWMDKQELHLVPVIRKVNKHRSLCLTRGPSLHGEGNL